MAFVVGTGPEVITIQGGGVTESFDAHEDIIFKRILKHINSKSLYQWPLLALAKDGYCTFRFKPTWMVWLNLSKDQYPETMSKKFHKII